MAASPSTPQADKSVLDYLGTIGRRKKIKEGLEVEELEKEGKDAIDGPTLSPAIENGPEEYILGEYEERTMLEPSFNHNREYQELLKILVNWINDELVDERIIVKSLPNDLYDGQILGKLVEKLSGQKLDVIEVTQNEDLQKYKLRVVLETANRHLGLQSKWVNSKWSVDGIHDKNPVEIIHLLVALIRHYRAPIKLPENVSVRVVVVQKREGQLHTRTVTEQLTGSFDELGMRVEPRDAFDTLFDHAPDKLQIVKRSLVNFVNRQLNSINIECFSGPTGSDLDANQFSDGLLLIFLMGTLEGYFVPLGNIYTTSDVDPLADNLIGKETALSFHNYINCSPINKLHNVNVAFQLMEDAGVYVKSKVRAEDIVNADLKSVLRVLYTIFDKYKHH
ncbi:alpha-parvin [Tetranychus urticae]|uniref:Calponin-homology (CH) domain-containing protein n=1 Tax=Tetranychus urticae TaxID=32264 RepID=T1KSR9_TETUR|nr:alpha-parvin [Tetranychus urticae]